MIYRLDSEREPAQCYAADDTAWNYHHGYTLLFPGSTVRLVEHRITSVVVVIVTNNQQNVPSDPPLWRPAPPGEWRISALTWPEFHPVHE